MRIRILTPMAGGAFRHEGVEIPEHAWDAGEIVDLPDTLAHAYCTEPADKPRAEPVEPTPETATKGAPENAMRPRPRRG